MADETTTVTLEDAEGTDELTVPTALIDLLSEDGESSVDVVGDLAMLGLAQQAHGLVHHSRGDVDAAIEDAEQLTMELFEQRFGQTYAEVTGHDH
jgi:hypothetical protein